MVFARKPLCSRLSATGDGMFLQWFMEYALMCDFMVLSATSNILRDQHHGAGEILPPFRFYERQRAVPLIMVKDVLEGIFSSDGNQIFRQCHIRIHPFPGGRANGSAFGFCGDQLFLYFPGAQTSSAST